MGREIVCRCTWGELEGEVHAALETSELIVRGPFRKRIAFSGIEKAEVRAGAFAFVASGEAVELALGTARAKHWAKAIASPPSLAHKLGIDASSKLFVFGNVDGPELQTALDVAETHVTSLAESDLGVARIDDVRTLTTFITFQASKAAPPFWIVYTKGRKAPLGEQAVRAALRDSGFMDTKVAAVSGTLTALRFVPRKT